MRPPRLDDLRRHAVARQLTRTTGLKSALHRLGFVQADPIRAPARAQDLILRHRVTGYRAGDLEVHYPRLDVEEDCLVNYGFVPRATAALMHPRQPKRPWDAAMQTQAEQVLAFIERRGATHPRDVQAAFDHGTVQGYWGGTLNASTQLLDGMHYRGLLRVVRRESGTRVYEAVQHGTADDSPTGRLQRARSLIDIVLQQYAPLPSRSLGYLVSLLGYGGPHLRTECRGVLAELRATLPQVTLDGVTWYWPQGESPASKRWQFDDTLRLLAPFDPIVWDRTRFELLWGWAYRFEAYTPAPKRLYGHYALPLLWRGQVGAWANVAVVKGQLQPQVGFVGPRPQDPAFNQALDEELQRLSDFLGL